MGKERILQLVKSGSSLSVAKTFSKLSVAKSFSIRSSQESAGEGKDKGGNGFRRFGCFKLAVK